MKMQNDQSKLDDVLKDVSEAEAKRLREVWAFADVQTDPLLSSSEVENALSTLHSDKENHLPVGGASAADSTSSIVLESQHERNARITSDSNSPDGSLTGPSAVELFDGVSLAQTQSIMKVRRHNVDATSMNKSTKQQRGPLRLTTLQRRVLFASAAVIAFVSIGLGLWLRPVTVEVPFGESRQVYLSDGSSMTINSGSSVTYPRRFGDRREVSLDGEAFFDIQSESRPFIVTTFNASVTVLGTRFNVRSRSEEMEPSTQVALESGRVQVDQLGDARKRTVLEPGQIGTVSSGQIAQELLETTVDDALAWLVGDVVFKDVALRTIIDEVQRRFNTSVKIETSPLLNERFTFVIRKPKDAEEVVRGIASATQLRYQIRSDGFELIGE